MEWHLYSANPRSKPCDRQCTIFCVVNVGCTVALPGVAGVLGMEVLCDDVRCSKAVVKRDQREYSSLRWAALTLIHSHHARYRSGQ